jgi:hypothetical protein
VADSSDDASVSAPEIHCFTLTVRVEEHHEACGDPEWVADAAAGALSNLYGLRCIYHDVERFDIDDSRPPEI